MHLIILSGGFGNRLWPLTNKANPKQFLKLLQNDKGEPESMVQRIYRQVQDIGGWDSISIATGASQVDLIYSQLGQEIDIVLEPSRRDTFPAIALASAYLYSEKKAGRNDVVAVVPIDSYVDTRFFKELKTMEKVFIDNSERNGIIGEEDQETSFVLMGAEPKEATEKYGYILPDLGKGKKEGFNNFYPVKQFKEKPIAEVAAELIEKGALWNCGVFAFRLGTVLDIISEKYIKDGEASYGWLKNSYEIMPKTSFDYEVIEKAKQVKVMPYFGQWLDLGTWESMSEMLKNQATGNVVLDEDLCRNTHIINDLDIPVLSTGIEDALLVASPDGIFLSSKSEAHKIKNMLGNISSRPMFETRRWGTYKVLNERANTLTKHLIINPGQSISYQCHNHRKEVWTLISGQGILYLEGKKTKVGPGEVIEIDKGVKHGIKATTELHIIEVQIGEYLNEDDIIRLKLDWD